LIISKKVFYHKLVNLLLGN